MMCRGGALLACARGALAHSGKRLRFHMIDVRDFVRLKSPPRPRADVSARRRYAAATVAAASAGLVAAHCAHAKEEDGPVLPAILAATRECIPKAVKEIDNEKVEAALKALRKQKSQEGHDARLDADEFRLVMNLISSKADSMVGIETCQMAIEVASLSTRASQKDAHDHAAPGASTLSDAQARKFLFEFFDVERQGQIGPGEVEGALRRLAIVAQAHTDGKFLEHVSLSSQGADGRGKEALSELAAVVLRDMRIASSSSGPVTKSGFDAWLASNKDSAKAVVLLFQTMGVSIAGAPGWDPSRYGGYAFLVARFTKLAGPTLTSKVRYLAFSSDVGEAFRPVAPKWMVNTTYAIAFSYCFFDVAYTGHKESKKEHGDVARAVIFQTIFQGLASIGLPYVIIHTAVHQSHKLCQKRAPKFAAVIPSLVGLAIIPLLPAVCDEPVEHLLEEAFEYAWPHPDSKDYGD